MSDIGLKAAIKLAETEQIGNKLNVYSIGYFKQDGTYRIKKKVCARNPEVDIHPEKLKKAGSPSSKQKYSPADTRTMRFFDLDTKKHFSISTDLWVYIDKFKIDHNR